MTTPDQTPTPTGQSRWSARLFTVLSIVAGVAASFTCQSLIHGNTEARNVIVTVFSIMAGFLIAIMTLLGDQSVLPGSWKIAKAQRDSLVAKLIRQKWLFYVYLITLSLIFIHTLIEKTYPNAAIWLERGYFGFATTAFVLSFGLPSTLMNVQAERIEAVLSARRGQASKLDRM